MVFLRLADQYIPGYALLTTRYREEFEASSAGKKFVAVVNAREKLLNEFAASNAWWHIFTRDRETKRQFLSDQFVSSKRVLFAEIESTKAYLQLLSHLVYPLIKSYEPDFCLLSAKQRDSLAKAPFSKSLYNIFSLENKIEQARKDFNALEQWQKPAASFVLKEQLAVIEEEKAKIINDWKKNFHTDPTMENLRQAIAKKKAYAAYKKLERKRERLRKNALALGEFFPLLNALGIQDQPFTHQIEAVNEEQLQKEEADLIFLELARFLNHHLCQLIGIPLQYVNVADYNKTQADSLAKLILKAFDTDKSFSPDVWIKNYKKGLLTQILTNLLLINGRIWQEQNELERLYSSSLANLFSMGKAMNKVKQFMNKFAQAHAFIQATGFATQNEFSYLAILDLYNYGQLADHIEDSKKIFFGLLRPFYPLYSEYRETALYEKSNIRKIFRTLMPMLVIVFFILGVSLLLTPFNLPEIFLLVLAAPVLITAVALAANYVSLKNAIYYSLRQCYFGGPFSIPEFQVNSRMKNAFVTDKNAYAIRCFFTNALKECDTQISVYRDKEKRALLSEVELRKMKETIARRHTLCIEWYDLHSNEELGYEEGVKIALARLKKEASTAYQDLCGLLNNSETIHLAVNSLVDALKLRLEDSNQWEKGSGTAIKPIASPLFFQPLSKKRELEHLVHLAEILDTIDTTSQQNVASMG